MKKEVGQFASAVGQKFFFFFLRMVHRLESLLPSFLPKRIVSPGEEFESQLKYNQKTKLALLPTDGYIIFSCII